MTVGTYYDFCLSLLGGLNFAYVNNSDSGGYRCEAYNQVLRKTVKSPVQTLTVTGGKSSQVSSKVSPYQ